MKKNNIELTPAVKALLLVAAVTVGATAVFYGGDKAPFSGEGEHLLDSVSADALQSKMKDRAIQFSFDVTEGESAVLDCGLSVDEKGQKFYAPELNSISIQSGDNVRVIYKAFADGGLFCTFGAEPAKGAQAMSDPKRPWDCLALDEKTNSGRLSFCAVKDGVIDDCVSDGGSFEKGSFYASTIAYGTRYMNAHCSAKLASVPDVSTVKGEALSSAHAAEAQAVLNAAPRNPSLVPNDGKFSRSRQKGERMFDLR